MIQNTHREKAHSTTVLGLVLQGAKISFLIVFILSRAMESTQKCTILISRLVNHTWFISYHLAFGCCTSDKYYFSIRSDVLCYLLLCLGVVAKSTVEADEKPTDISNTQNGPSIEEPQSLDMPQHATKAASQRPADDRVSNLELENTLLRKEVASLNEEMVSVVQRAKEAERSMCNSSRGLLS